MTHDWAASLLPLCQQVAIELLAIYEQHLASPMTIERKGDNTPLTRADMRAHELLQQGLQRIAPEIPILSEESAQIDIAQRQNWQRYWLVDPIDGTQEFINGTDEFCCCIALIENHQPIFGFIYAPVSGDAWWGGQGVAATKYTQKQTTAIACNNDNLIMVASSRGFDRRDVKALLEELNCGTLAMGSALKYCAIAEGKAQIYPSLGPTSEWDSAAGQAIIEAAGGVVVDTAGEPLRYNCNANGELLNPPFYALADVSLLP